MKYYRFILLIIILLYSNCRHRDCISNYNFEIPIEVTPSQSILNIGDTMSVSIFLDTRSINDTHGERIVEIDNFDPNAWFLMPVLDSFPVFDGFLENEVIIDSGYSISHIPVRTLSSGLFFREINHGENFSLIEFKVVFRKRGTYALYAESALFNVDTSDPILFDERCGGRGTSTLQAYYIFNGMLNPSDDLLSNENRIIEDSYWAEREGQRKKSDAYYFKVE